MSTSILGRQPSLWLGLINTIVAALVGFGLPLTHVQVGVVTTAAAAVIGLAGAITVRPFPVPMLMGAVHTILAACVAFGLPLTTDQVGFINALIAAAVGFILRQHVSPTRKAFDPTPEDGAGRVARAA